MPARKKSTAKSGKKRVSRAEPKSIIKRKSAGKKAASKAATKRSGRKSTETKSTRKRSAAKPERVVGTNKEVARKIVKMRDAGESWPKIKAATGLGGMTIRNLYSEASGKDWQDATIERSPGGRTRKKATSKKATSKAPAKKSAGRKARASKAETETAPRKTRKVKKSRSSKNGGTETTKKAGRGKAGRKAKKDRNAQVLRDIIWDTDTDLKTLKAEMQGKRITVEREGLKPADFKVVKVKETSLSDREGKIIHYIDDDGKARFVSTREITAIR